MNSFENLRLLKQRMGQRGIVPVYDPGTIWKSPPVDFITFCRDWVREPLFEGHQEELARAIIGKPTVNDLWDFNYQTILLAWGKSSGKGSISAKLLTYTGYLLKLMRDPRKYFHLGRTAPIHMLNVSYNYRQAKQIFFNGYLVPTILNTINPKTGRNFFEEQGMDMRIGERDILADTIHFERPSTSGEGGISAISLAGDKGTAEGYSPLLIFVDEISAMQNPVKADELIDDLEKSAQSRYGNRYKLMVASFKKGKNCLMSSKVAEVEEKSIPGVFLSKGATWEVNKMRKREEFQNAYQKNPVKAARTFEFKEIGSVDDSTYFKLPDKLLAAFRDESTNPLSGNITYCRSEELKSLLFKEWFVPNNRLKYNLHIDLAKGTSSDRCGLVMTHKQGFESLQGNEVQNYISGEMSDKVFKVKMDLALQVRPNSSGQIIIDEIYNFIVRIQKMGFNLSVSFDGYQSLSVIQNLQQINIVTDLISVDRDRKVYDTLQALIYSGDFEGYDHPTLLRELKELQESEDGRKIDHPFKSLERARSEEKIPYGSKDISDALSASVFKSILNDNPRIPLPILMSEGLTRNKTIVSNHGPESENDLDYFERQLLGGSIPIKSNSINDYYGIKPSHRRSLPFLKG